MPDVRHAIVLVLDDRAGSIVRRLAEQLDPLPHTLLPTGVRPHVTLAVCTGLDVAGFEPVLRECAEGRQALECTLASLGIFPTPEGVLFLGVAPSPQLVELQAEICKRLRDMGAQVEPYWIPGQWMPHCTLSTGVARELMPVAVGRIAIGLEPISGLLTRLLVAGVDSSEICYAIDLARAG
jgi:2'-5' RNA ligase